MKYLIAITLLFTQINCEDTVNTIFPRRINIIEGDEVILQGIREISAKNDTLLLIDGSGSLVLTIDLKNGNILDYKEPDFRLIDSVANKLKSIYPNRNTIWQRFDTKYMLEEYGFDASKSNYKFNKFEKILEYENDIIISTYMNSYAFDINDSNHKTLTNDCGLLHFNNKLELQRVTMFQSENDIFTRVPLKKISDNYILAVLNSIKFAINPDSVSWIAKYDDKGNYIKTLEYMPEFFVKKRIGYNLPNLPIISLWKDELVSTSHYSEKIKFNKSGKIIKLKGLDWSNKDNYDKLDSIIDNNLWGSFKILGYFINRVDRLFFNDDFMYVLLGSRDKQNNKIQILQKYDVATGNLMGTQRINEPGYKCATLSKDFSKLISAHFDDDKEIYYLFIQEINI